MAVAMASVIAMPMPMPMGRGSRDALMVVVVLVLVLVVMLVLVLVISLGPDRRDPGASQQQRYGEWAHGGGRTTAHTMRSPLGGESRPRQPQSCLRGQGPVCSPPTTGTRSWVSRGQCSATQSGAGMPRRIQVRL